MRFKDFIEKLGMIHSSNPVTEDTKIDVIVLDPFIEDKDTDGCTPDIEASILDIDFDYKSNTLTIICREE